MQFCFWLLKTFHVLIAERYRNAHEIFVEVGLVIIIYGDRLYGLTDWHLLMVVNVDLLKTINW